MAALLFGIIIYLVVDIFAGDFALPHLTSKNK